MIGKVVIRNGKRRKTNLNMVWVDFRKAYDMVPHVWIINALKLIGAAPNVIALLKSTVIDWKTEFISRDISLGEVDINRGIFQGDSLSPFFCYINDSFNTSFETNEKRIFISKG